MTADQWAEKFLAVVRERDDLRRKLADCTCAEDNSLEQAREWAES